MLLWLQQLQDKLPADDTRLQQDLNKIIAAVQFSADTMLNTARFASKTMASALAARRLLWLRHWQADAHHKWRLSSAPFTGDKLFGPALDPLLVEMKDKRKMLPTSQRRGDFRYSPFFCMPPFRGSDWGPGTSHFQGSFRPRQRGHQDRPL